jgi:hypothetical protein
VFYLLASVGFKFKIAKMFNSSPRTVNPCSLPIIQKRINSLVHSELLQDLFPLRQNIPGDINKSKHR